VLKVILRNAAKILVNIVINHLMHHHETAWTQVQSAGVVSDVSNCFHCTLQEGSDLKVSGAGGMG
jgi:hypothetical protein